MKPFALHGHEKLPQRIPGLQKWQVIKNNPLPGHNVQMMNSLAEGNVGKNDSIFFLQDILNSRISKERAQPGCPGGVMVHSRLLD